MADTLLAILLVTSAKDKNIIFHWPPEPSISPRLARPRPSKDAGCTHIDTFWLATRTHNQKKSSPPAINSNDTNIERGDPQEDGWEYEWVRPNAFRQRSQSFHNSSSRPSSGRNSPVLDRASFDVDADRHFIEKEYGSLLGYPAEFLAGMLCPQSTLCHQKFEWIVDDLAFIGHPVCADIDGQWRFKTEPSWIRGRNSRNRHRSQDFEPEPPISEIEVEPESPDALSLSISSALQQFHLVLVLDIPDPLSTSSKNISKYIHVIYEQIAFMFTAVLYQEQVSNHFMEKESDGLSMLRESCINKGENFNEFVSKALESSQLARSIKSIYESVVSQTIARILINDSAIELQLPPYLPSLLLGSSDTTVIHDLDNEDADFVASGREPSYNWRLPQLKPWKSILLTDVEIEKEQLIMTLSKPGLSPEDQDVYESLIQFLQSGTVFESLAEIADSLGWDLEQKVFPIVRWLVYHHKARVVDRVHEGLRTVFVLSDKLQHSKIAELTAEFSNDFPSTAIPTFPHLLSRMTAQSIDTSSESGVNKNKAQLHQHFFATLVRTKSSIPIYRDVVTWMLKRELIVALHLRIRIVATREIKMRVREKYGFGNGRRMGVDDKEEDEEESVKGKFERSSIDKDGDRMTGGSGLSSLFSEQSRGRDNRPRHRRRRRSSSQSYKSSVISSMILEKKEVGFGSVSSRSRNESDEKYRDSDDEDIYRDENGGDASGVKSSVIICPAQASRKEKLWIEAMSERMEMRITEKFERIYKYFDGIKTSDEVLYRAGISRRDLREVLHCYEEFLITFLHP